MSLLLSGIKFNSNKKKNCIVRIATLQVQVSQQSADDDDDEVLSVLVNDPATFNFGVIISNIVLNHEFVFVM